LVPSSIMLRRAALAAKYAPAAVQIRSASKIVPHGKGGRSSIGGSVATVFGAENYLGRYIVGKFAKSGSQVICPNPGVCELETRPLRVMGDLGQIHLVDYALLDQRSIPKTVEFSNIAINCTDLAYKTRHYLYNDIHVEGARNLAKAAKAAGVERFIHVSALGADVDSGSGYLKSKALGEIAVREEFPEATIVRAGPMFGQEDSFIVRLADLCKLPGPFALLNMGEAVKKPVYVGDVAQGILESVSTPEAAGQTYEFYGPKDYTMKDIMTYIGDTTRKPVWTVPVPDLATAPFLTAMSIPGMARIAMLPNEEEFYRYAKDDVAVKGAPTLSDLGVKATPLEAVGLSILRRFRSHLYHDDIDTVLSQASSK